MSGYNLANTVPAILRYFTPPADGAAPFTIAAAPTNAVSDEPEGNWQLENRIMAVEDVRGKEHAFSLDVHGFQFVRHVSAETEFVDEQRIKEVYYKEAEELLKRVTGAKRVLIFDNTIRCALAILRKDVAGNADLGW